VPKSSAVGSRCLERREALRHGHDLDRVDVDVRRERRDPVDRLGDVLGAERLHAVIHGARALLIAVEPHGRELGASGHAGLDAGDAHAGAVQVAAQVQAELVHERLAGAVDVAAGVRIAAGDRADVDDVAAAALDHPGEHGARQVDQALAVGVDHLVPVVEVGALRRLEALGEAGVVDQDVDRGKRGRQRPHRALDGLAVAHVELEGEHAIAELGDELRQPVGAARACDDPGTAGGKLPHGRRAEPGAGAGDKHRRDGRHRRPPRRACCPAGCWACGQACCPACGSRGGMRRWSAGSIVRIIAACSEGMRRAATVRQAFRVIDRWGISSMARSPIAHPAVARFRPWHSRPDGVSWRGAT
jgi:hypothetical protein